MLLIIFRIGIIFLFLSGYVCSQEEEKEEKIDPIPIVIRGNNAFAFKLYETIKTDHGNIYVSPYGITSALAILYSGARESTLAELRKIMHVSLSAEYVNSAYDSLNKAFSSPRTEVDTRAAHLFLANSLWLQQGYPLVPDFRKIMQTTWRASFQQTDFSSFPLAALQKINYWIKVKTNGRILDFLPQGSVTKETLMLLESAGYIRAPWAQAFDKRLSRMDAFFTNEAITVSMPFMTLLADLPYQKFDLFELLEIPLNSIRESSTQLAFYILLPNRVDGLPAVETALSGGSWNDWLKRLELKKIMLSLPKFTLLDTLDLKDILARMGMSAPFTDRADFSGITGERELFINSFLHKAFITMDEMGLDSAAALASSAGSVPGTVEPIYFRVNHPFFFLVMDKTTKTVLCIGRLTSPQT